MPKCAALHMRTSLSSHSSLWLHDKLHTASCCHLPSAHADDNEDTQDDAASDSASASQAAEPASAFPASARAGPSQSSSQRTTTDCVVDELLAQAAHPSDSGNADPLSTASAAILRNVGAALEVQRDVFPPLEKVGKDGKRRS